MALRSVIVQSSPVEMPGVTAVLCTVLVGLDMATIVFVTRLTPPARDLLRHQAIVNGRTMAAEARVLIEDALGIDRSRGVAVKLSRRRGKSASGRRE